MKTEPPRRLAVLSATPFEIEPLFESGQERVGGWPVIGEGEVAGVPAIFAVSGVGKASAAAAVAALASGHGATAVILVGVGGAYPGSSMDLGAAALAGSETDLDLGVGRHPSWRGVNTLAIPGEDVDNVIPLAGAALDAAVYATGLAPVAFATSDSVTADAAHASYVRDRFGVAVESMEGAGAARAARALGVVFLELRGVSNVVGERERASWRLAEAISAACRAATLALPAVREVI